MRTISFRLDEHTDALLSAFCQRHGVSQTEALKAAIAGLPTEHPTRPADLARDMGLIGSFRSAEGDLGEQHSLHLKQRLRAKLARETDPRRDPAARSRHRS
jgi:hypothetical protein